MLGYLGEPSIQLTKWSSKINDLMFFLRSLAWQQNHWSAGYSPEAQGTCIPTVRSLPLPRTIPLAPSTMSLFSWDPINKPQTLIQAHDVALWRCSSPPQLPSSMMHGGHLMMHTCDPCLVAEVLSHMLQAPWQLRKMTTLIQLTSKIVKHHFSDRLLGAGLGSASISDHSFHLSE